MALQLILGNSGAGKSYYRLQKIIKASMEHPEKQYLIIVPEQFTMQTQKDLVMMHPRHGIMNIDVLSFERLAHRVFHEVGGEHRKILEDTGKNLILRRLAEEKKEELTLLGKNLKRLGYISEIKSLISEFTQYNFGCKPALLFRSTRHLNTHTNTNQQNARRSQRLSGALLCRFWSDFLALQYQWQPYIAKYP